MYENYPYGINPNQMVQNQQQRSQYAVPVTVPPQPIIDTPEIETGGFSFKVLGENEKDDCALPIPSETTLPEPKKKRGRPKGSVNSKDIVKAESEKGEVLTSAAYTYAETTDMLHATLAQIDELSFGIRQELDSVRASRTMRNKYGAMTDLTENLTSLISSKIQVIKEINSSISKANDLDYKRQKDAMAVSGAENDEKHIMDMYSAFVQNPNGSPNNILGPSMMDSSMIGSSDIIRADASPTPAGQLPDLGYLNYISNITPEQNMMFLESNPNIKEVVVFDHATGNKFFQVMDMSTMQVVPNVPVKSQMFMEDTVLDLKNHIAKNVNLNATYPIVEINVDTVKEY